MKFKLLCKETGTMLHQTKIQRMLLVAISFIVLFLTAGCNRGITKFDISAKSKVYVDNSIKDVTKRLVTAELTCGEPPLPPCQPPPLPPPQGPMQTLGLTSDHLKIYCSTSNVIVKVDSSKRTITYEIKATWPMK